MHLPSGHYQPYLAWAILLPPETKYLCDWRVMTKKAKATEMSSPTSSPRKMADMNVTIQIILWKSRREKEGRDKKQNWENHQSYLLIYLYPLPPNTGDLENQFLSHVDWCLHKWFGPKIAQQIFLCILGHFLQFSLETSVSLHVK